MPAGHAEKQQVRNKNEKRANGHTGRDHTDRLPPRLEITASKEPITINMNVKIEHEIHISVDKDVEALLKSRSDLF
ncbi:YnbE family lipoprotein [Enterobacteriaceae bacterium ESL0689]|nr:YnbE family lipoprotein [Enterobacteriaceae bacterium ESL0689]